MNEELKKRWVDALRSGKYAQGQLYLNKDRRFCCLGVLCDLLVEDGKVKRECQLNGVVAYGAPNGYKSESNLSYDIKLIVGIDEDLQACLISLNDEFNKTFLEIAQVIEDGTAISLAQRLKEEKEAYDRGLMNGGID